MLSEPDVPIPKRAWYRRKGCLLGVIALIAPFAFVGFLILAAWFESSGPTYYERGSEFPFDKLPASAHDVRLVRSSPFASTGRVYEFTCTEEDFRSWVDATRIENPELGDIKKVEYGTRPFITSNGELEIKPISEFLISEWTFEDQGLHLIYEKKVGRALRWSHSR